MRSSQKIRKIFPSLQVLPTVQVTGLLDQIYDSRIGMYFPQRSATENVLQLQPHVYVSTGDTDKTWTNGEYVSKCSINWYANGQPIAQTPLNGYFSATVSSTDTNGLLKVWKNIGPTERYDLVAVGQFVDGRTNEVVRFQTDPVSIGTTENSADEIDFSVAHLTAIQYHPLLDKLKEYDWLVAQDPVNYTKLKEAYPRNAGETDAQWLNRIKHPETLRHYKGNCNVYDGNQYLLNLPILITRGAFEVKPTDPMWAVTTVELYVQKGNEQIRVTPDNCIFLREIDNSHIFLDLRFIPDGTTLVVKLKVNGKTMSDEYLSYTFVIDDHYAEPEFNYSILDGNFNPRNRAVATVLGEHVNYIEAYFRLKWSTTTINLDECFQGEGEYVTLDLAKASIGDGVNGWMNVNLDYFVKAFAAALTVDADGNIIITDDEGNVITTDVYVG